MFNRPNSLCKKGSFGYEKNDLIEIKLNRKKLDEFFFKINIDEVKFIIKQEKLSWISNFLNWIFNELDKDEHILELNIFLKLIQTSRLEYVDYKSQKKIFFLKNLLIYSNEMLKQILLLEHTSILKIILNFFDVVKHENFCKETIEHILIILKPNFERIIKITDLKMRNKLMKLILKLIYNSFESSYLIKKFSNNIWKMISYILKLPKDKYQKKSFQILFLFVDKIDILFSTKLKKNNKKVKKYIICRTSFFFEIMFLQKQEKICNVTFKLIQQMKVFEVSSNLKKEFGNFQKIISIMKLKFQKMFKINPKTNVNIYFVISSIVCINRMLFKKKSFFLGRNTNKYFKKIINMFLDSIKKRNEILEMLFELIETINLFIIISNVSKIKIQTFQNLMENIDLFKKMYDLYSLPVQKEFIQIFYRLIKVSRYKFSKKIRKIRLKSFGKTLLIVKNSLFSIFKLIKRRKNEIFLVLKLIDINITFFQEYHIIIEKVKSFKKILENIYLICFPHLESYFVLENFSRVIEATDIYFIKKLTSKKIFVFETIIKSIQKVFEKTLIFLKEKIYTFKLIIEFLVRTRFFLNKNFNNSETEKFKGFILDMTLILLEALNKKKNIFFQILLNLLIIYSEIFIKEDNGKILKKLRSVIRYIRNLIINGLLLKDSQEIINFIMNLLKKSYILSNRKIFLKRKLQA